MREIILDTETTGLDPDQGHRIVEIGCIELVDGFRTGNYFHQYIFPERSMPAEAERVHGLSDIFLKDKPIFSEIVESFLEFIREDILVIHNAAFDIKFLNAELKKQKKNRLKNNVVDTLLLAKKKYPGAKANLDALCQKLGVDRSGRVKHGALLDAELLAEVYNHMLGRKAQLSMFDTEEPIKTVSIKKVKSRQFHQGIFNSFSGKILVPTEEETQLHQVLLKKIKNAVWPKP